MAQPYITSTLPPATSPSYGSITPSPDIGAQRQHQPPCLPPRSPVQSPCHVCGNDRLFQLPRSWIHAIFGLQGARDPKNNKEEFQAVALFFCLGLGVIIGLTLIVIFVPGPGASIGTCLIFMGVVVALFTAFPSPWCGEGGSCKGFFPGT